LAPRVNVIPVIGKSDTLTPKELRDFKARVSDRQVHKLAFKFEIDFIRAH
jgi:cell division control protein 11